MMLIPIRTLVVFAASQGISVMPWNHLPREMTGRAFGRSVIIPNGYCSSTRSEASGTQTRSRVQTESKSRFSARAVRSSSSLTVTSSRKFGRYRASFIDRPPRDAWISRDCLLGATMAHQSQRSINWRPAGAHRYPAPLGSSHGGADDRDALESHRGPHCQVGAARVPELAGRPRWAPVPRPRRPVGLVGGRPGRILEFHRRVLRGRVLGPAGAGAHRRSDAAGPLVHRRPAELG